MNQIQIKELDTIFKNKLSPVREGKGRKKLESVDPTRMLLFLMTELNKELMPKRWNKFTTRKHKTALWEANCLDNRYKEFKRAQNTKM